MVIYIRRIDVDWQQTLPTWSGYDLDAMIRDCEEEKMRRNSPMVKAFRGV